MSPFKSRLLLAGPLSAVVLAGLLWLPAATAKAQEVSPPAPTTGAAALPAPVIVVVDVDQILQESVAAKSVRSQADKYQQSFQDETSKEETRLRATQQEIEQQRKTLSPEAFAEKARAFENSFGDYQRKVNARRQAFSKSVSIAMGHVQQAMLEATQQVTVARGANIVLPRTQVMLFDDKMNATKDIIAVMDKKLTHVDFPAPKVEPEAAPPANTTSGAAKKKSQ